MSEQKQMRKFPKDFFWGAATAAFQVEGGITNTDWSKAGEEGKVPKAGRSSDHYHRYEEDFSVAQSLGHNCHRLSIPWARIEPNEGEFDYEAVEHYRNILLALHKRKLEPFVTLYHFVLPLWFSESGGWERKDAPEIFARYCSFIVNELNDTCAHYATINEPVVMASNGWLRGNWPPFTKYNIFKFLKVTSNLAKAHNLAYLKIKMHHPGVDVGIVKDNMYFHANWNPVNKLSAAFMSWFWNRRFLNKVKHNVDNIGLNYYFHKEFGKRKTYQKSDMGWDLYPEGLYHTLMELKRYERAVFIAEAGIADEADKLRGEYIKDLVRFTHKLWKM